jgi:hypothetical protein
MTKHKGARAHCRMQMMRVSAWSECALHELLPLRMLQPGIGTWHCLPLIIRACMSSEVLLL